jgi:hypothetical protein
MKVSPSLSKKESIESEGASPSHLEKEYWGIK